MNHSRAIASVLACAALLAGCSDIHFVAHTCSEEGQECADAGSQSGAASGKSATHWVRPQAVSSETASDTDNVPGVEVRVREALPGEYPAYIDIITMGDLDGNVWEKRREFNGDGSAFVAAPEQPEPKQRIDRKQTRRPGKRSAAARSPADEAKEIELMLGSGKPKSVCEALCCF